MVAEDDDHCAVDVGTENAEEPTGPVKFVAPGNKKAPIPYRIEALTTRAGRSYPEEIPITRPTAGLATAIPKAPRCVQLVQQDLTRADRYRVCLPAVRAK